MSVTINDSGEGAMPKFEAVMAMKNAEIGELRQRAEQLQRDYEAAREACQRGRQTEEALTHQLAKADDRNVKLRQRAARAEAECERLRGIIYGVAFNLDHDAPRDIIVRCRESLTAALSPAPDAGWVDRPKCEGCGYWMPVDFDRCAACDRPRPPAPAAKKPWDVPENWAAVRNAAGNVMWYENAQAPPGMGIRNTPYPAPAVDYRAEALAWRAHYLSPLIGAVTDSVTWAACAATKKALDKIVASNRAKEAANG